jgi:hypothetical protein
VATAAREGTTPRAVAEAILAGHADAILDD